MHASSASTWLRSTIRRALVWTVLSATLFGAAHATQAIGDDFPPDWMAAADLKATFAGTTITGHYADGRPFKESYAKNGRLKYVEKLNHRTQVGHWSVIAGSFCTIYDLNPTGGCFRVRRHSANCFEFYFLTRTETQARRPEPGRPSWTARAWRVDRPSTCNEKPIV
jgi:hypothetical protein